LKCGKEIQPDWKACPYCGGYVLAEVVEHPLDSSTLPSGPANPYAINQQQPAMIETQQEAGRDLTGIGLGLIVLGVLGFLGCLLIVFSGNLTALGSIEGVQAGILMAGGTVIALVIVGSSMIAIGGRGNAVHRGASGVLGGLLAGLMILGFAALWVVAAVIYLIEDCLRGCQ
jgi:hypothetical protein